MLNSRKLNFFLENTEISEYFVNVKKGIFGIFENFRPPPLPFNFGGTLWTKFDSKYVFSLPKRREFYNHTLHFL